MIEESPQVFEFDEFRLDTMKRQLTRTGEVVPLYSKAFDLLLVLVSNSGRDLTKDELLDRVWPGQILEESNLSVNMSAIRRALGEKAAEPRYIVTVPGRGYRFVAAVRVKGNELSGVVVATQTISQITIEEETETVPEALPQHVTRNATLVNASEDGHQFDRSKALAGRTAPRPSLLRSPFVLAGLTIFGVGVALAAAFIIRQNREDRAVPNRFQQVKLRQLTNDGGVVNAAISPDGKLFVFVHAEKEKKSLRLGQTNGEAPIELRPSADVVYRGLEFAPDGSSVYYVIEDGALNNHSLYRLPLLGGVPVKLRDDISSYFSIAPDNKRVAFVRSDASRAITNFVVSNLDGSNERVVLSLPSNRGVSSLNLCWSPDGSRLAFGASNDDKQTASGIFLLQIDTGDLKPLTPPIWREIERIAWLKDGSGITANAASTGTPEYRQVWLVAIPSGEAHRITNDLNSYDIGISVTSDSNNILAVSHQQMSNIWVAPAEDLSQARQITFGALNRGDGGAGVDWAPNRRVVYATAISQSRTLWVMDADGANAKELTPPGANDTVPSVTGDGRFIVFESDRGGANEIWRANIDGSEPKQLTNCGKNYEPDVSPDGKWVVYRSSCESSGLWRVSIDGGQPTRLTTVSAFWPWISPDSKWIGCEYLTDGAKAQLAIIPIEGGQPVKLFDVPPRANFRYGVRWTPDGKAVTYRDWDKGIWRQAIEGGAPQQIPGLPAEKIYSYGWSRDGKIFAFTRGTEIRDVVLISNTK